MLRLPGWVVAVLIVALLAANGSADVAPPAGADGVAPPAAGKRIAGLPSSMTALGDSVTAGVGTCVPTDLGLGCEAYSWSTGTAPEVNSHYRRILAHNPAIAGRAYNLAEHGAHAADLPAQAQAAVRLKAQYVTILIGANDACARNPDDMTPVDDFRYFIDLALDALRTGLPKARVLIVSIPNLYRLWEVGHRLLLTRFVWLLGECPSLLDRPTSMAPADKRRRSRVANQVKRYNKELAEACRRYGDRCRWDGGEVYRTRFSLEHVNFFDRFHPSITGQRRLAAVTYPGRFDR